MLCRFNWHGLGQWYHIVAGLGYTKRKLAQWVFGSAPEGTYDQAYEYYKKAEDAKPRFWVRNALKLAQVSANLGRKEEARKWIAQARDMKANGAEWEEDDSKDLAAAEKLV